MSILEYFWIAFIAIEKYSSVAVFGGEGVLYSTTRSEPSFEPHCACESESPGMECVLTWAKWSA